MNKQRENNLLGKSDNFYLLGSVIWIKQFVALVIDGSVTLSCVQVMTLHNCVWNLDQYVHRSSQNEHSSTSLVLQNKPGENFISRDFVLHTLQCIVLTDVWKWVKKCFWKA